MLGRLSPFPLTCPVAVELLCARGGLGLKISRGFMGLAGHKRPEYTGLLLKFKN